MVITYIPPHRNSGMATKLATVMLCSEHGCTRRIHAKGLCMTHYTGLRQSTGSPCSIDGCDGRVHSKGLCQKHYRQQGRNPPEVVVPDPAAPMKHICSRPNCNNPGTYREGDGRICDMHRKRVERGIADTECVSSGCSVLAKGPRGLCDKHEIALFREIDDRIEFEGGVRGDPVARAPILAELEREGVIRGIKPADPAKNESKVFSFDCEEIHPDDWNSDNTTASVIPPTVELDDIDAALAVRAYDRDVAEAVRLGDDGFSVKVPEEIRHIVENPVLLERYRERARGIKTVGDIAEDERRVRTGTIMVEPIAA